jgi:hypothetical protein
MGNSDKRGPVPPALQQAPDERNLNRRNILLGGTTLAAASAIAGGAPITVAQAQAQFIETFKEFPPRQTPSSFSVDQIMETLKRPPGG